MSLITIVTAIPDFEGLDYIVYLPEKQRVQKQAWHNSRINASNY
jgi:hypothetical protein